MNMTRRSLLAGAAALALTPKARASQTAPPPFHRGTSIHNMLNWGRVEESDRSRYAWPPFSTPGHQLMPGLLPNLKAAGFDFIRLTVDTGVFLQFTGQERNDLDRQLMGAVERLREAGFGVIVDLHPTWQVPAYAPEKITASADSALFRAYGEMLRRTARLLAPLSKERVALELMNEPQWGWDKPSTERWRGQLKVWHDLARGAAPDLMLVLSGARGGDLEGLTALSAAPYAGSNLIWTFHYYKPYLLTHQGVKGDNEQNRLWRYMSDLPYPAAPEHYEDAWSILRRNVLADEAIKASQRPAILADVRKQLKDYLDSRPGRARIAADFQSVMDWAAREKVSADRILLGEFGITRTYGQYRASPEGPLANYLGDVRSEAEARGFGWAVWAATGYGGMALVAEDDKPDLDRTTLAALGLRTP